jgi:hypothetical protein
MSEENFENTDIVFSKRPIEEIIEDSKTIIAEKVGLEVLTWVITNVENFIDNHNKMFKLDLVVDKSKGMEETKRLQDLYRAIPEDENNEKELERAEKCRRLLDEITKKSFEYIKGSKELLKVLFERMIFYYETVVPNPENKKRALAIDEELKNLFRQKEENETEEGKAKIQEEIVEKIKKGEKLVKFTELEGNVSITNFDYEAFSVGVRIQKGAKNSDQDIKTCPVREVEVMKSYTIEEGFTVWVEINFKHKQRPTGMF